MEKYFQEINMKTLALIHTIPNWQPLIYDPFARPFLAEHPGVKIINLMDDSLLTETTTAGKPTSAVIRRIGHMVEASADAGADVAMITCTSVNTAARILRPISRIPLFNIDEPNAEQTIDAAEKIGIIATLPTSPAATASLLQSIAAERGKPIQLKSVVVDGAFEVLSSGDRVRHDAMVCEKLYQLQNETDAIVFAQVSMGKVIHNPLKVPVFKIGKSGFDRAATMLGL